MTRRWPCFVVTTLCCLLTLATSPSAEEPSQETANAIREQARAAAVRAEEQAVRVNLRWLLWSEETVMVAEAPREHVFAYPTRMVRYLCLPDTVDPRWPKGK